MADEATIGEEATGDARDVAGGDSCAEAAGCTGAMLWRVTAAACDAATAGKDFGELGVLLPNTEDTGNASVEAAAAKGSTITGGGSGEHRGLDCPLFGRKASSCIAVDGTGTSEGRRRLCPLPGSAICS